MAVLVCLLLKGFTFLILFSDVSLQAKDFETENGESCQNTYYIQDYHVYRAKGKDLAGKVRGKRNDTDRGSVMIDEEEEQAKKVEEIYEKLIKEKNHRLRDLLVFTEWLNDLEEEELVSELRDKFRRHIMQLKGEIEDIFDTEISEEPNDKAQNKAKILVEERNDAAATLESMQNFEENVQDWEEKINRLLKANARLERELRQTRLQQNEMLRLHRNLFSSHKILQKEFQRADERHNRFELYYHSEIQRLKWKISNESDLWQAGIKHLDAQLYCDKQENQMSERCKFIFPPKTENEKKNLIENTLRKMSSNFHENGRIPTIPQQKTENVPQIQPKASKITKPHDQGYIDVSLNLQKTSTEKPRDCSEIDFDVQKQSPIQVIYTRNQSTPLQVYCEEGWTLIQNNTRGESRSTLTWQDYRVGFGHADSAKYWIGNEFLHQLTTERKFTLQIDMVRHDYAFVLHSKYTRFRVGNESNWYQLFIDNYSGDAGDIMGLFSTTPLNHCPFLTKDKNPVLKKDLVENGWWYPRNVQVDVNGNPELCYTNLNHDFPWFCEKEGVIPLQHVSMKIKPIDSF